MVPVPPVLFSTTTFCPSVLRQHRRQHAGRHVGQPARRERHDHGDGAVGIFLGLRGSRQGAAEQSADQSEAKRSEFI